MNKYLGYADSLFLTSAGILVSKTNFANAILTISIRKLKFSIVLAISIAFDFYSEFACRYHFTKFAVLVLLEGQ